MIQHNINPVLFNIGPLSVRWYGLIYALGFLLVYWILWKAASKGSVKNLDQNKVDSYMILAILATVIGARVFHVFVFEFSYYKDHLLDFFKIWNGGLAFHGALAGMILVTWYYCRRHKISFYEIADQVVLPLGLVLFFGRIANFINAEMIGTASGLPWCITYAGVEGCRHPTVLYEALKNLFIFGVLFAWNGRKMIVKDLKEKKGIYFWSFITLYGLFRFFLMFLRDGEAQVLPGMTLAQVFALLMSLVGAIVIAKKYLLKRFLASDRRLNKKKK